MQSNGKMGTIRKMIKCMCSQEGRGGRTRFLSPSQPPLLYQTCSSTSPFCFHWSTTHLHPLDPPLPSGSDFICPSPLPWLLPLSASLLIIFHHLIAFLFPHHPPSCLHLHLPLAPLTFCGIWSQRLDNQSSTCICVPNLPPQLPGSICF